MNECSAVPATGQRIGPGNRFQLILSFVDPPRQRTENEHQFQDNDEHRHQPKADVQLPEVFEIGLCVALILPDRKIERGEQATKTVVAKCFDFVQVHRLAVRRECHQTPGLSKKGLDTVVQHSDAAEINAYDPAGHAWSIFAAVTSRQRVVRRLHLGNRFVDTCKFIGPWAQLCLCFDARLSNEAGDPLRQHPLFAGHIDDGRVLLLLAHDPIR